MEKTYKQIYYEKNKEKIKAKVRKFREDPEYRKKQAIWNKKWKADPKNRERILEIRRNSQNKIHKILRKVGYVTTEIRKRIYERDGNKCLCCGSKKNLTVDHIIPISKNGITIDNNLQTLCVACNSKKFDKIISYLK